MKASVDPISEPSFGPPLPQQHHLCQCPLCRRERKFYRIANKLPPRDEAWLLNFYDYIVQHEREFAKACTQRKPGHP